MERNQRNSRVRTGEKIKERGLQASFFDLAVIGQDPATVHNAQGANQKVHCRDAAVGDRLFAAWTGRLSSPEKGLETFSSLTKCGC